MPFPATDDVGRELATAVHKILTEKYPPTAVHAYNMETGERVTHTYGNHSQHLDPEIAAWIGESDDRWLGVGSPMVFFANTVRSDRNMLTQHIVELLCRAASLPVRC